ncbi:MAG: ABC transporter ATP-binding protein [Nanoarchaeota archaeon]
MIEAKKLFFRYEDDYVLENASMHVNEGVITAIIGANGSGKTTLAKHLNGLLIPKKGDVFVDGISTKKDEFNARKKVGFVFQNFEDQIVYPVVEEDISFGLENIGLGSNDVKIIVKKTMEGLGIGNLAKKNVNTLSIGQRQLVAIAGVLAMEPKYAVFDEPATMLDPINRKKIMSTIKRISREGITPILVTNSMDDLKYAGKVVVMKSGKVIFEGKKSELKNGIIKKAGIYA